MVCVADHLGSKAEELAQHSLVGRIRLSALREESELDPERLTGETRHHGRSAAAAWFITIEEHGQEPHPGFMAQ
jgi:hypothetical protein